MRSAAVRSAAVPAADAEPDEDPPRTEESDDAVKAVVGLLLVSLVFTTITPSPMASRDVRRRGDEMKPKSSNKNYNENDSARKV